MNRPPRTLREVSTWRSKGIGGLLGVERRHALVVGGEGAAEVERPGRPLWIATNSSACGQVRVRASSATYPTKWATMSRASGARRRSPGWNSRRMLATWRLTASPSRNGKNSAAW